MLLLCVLLCVLHSSAYITRSAARLHSKLFSTITAEAPLQSILLPSLYWNWKGYNIRYTKAGPKNGTPIVLIHGFGASLDYFRNQIPVFAAAGYSVYGIDLLGFGGSEKALQPEGTGYSSTLWSTQVLDFCSDMGLNDAILAGNSIGSRIALEAALISPESVKGLLLYNAAAGINNKFTITDTLTPFTLKLFAVPIFTLLDILLKQDWFGTWLFERTKNPENIRKTLQSVYVNKGTLVYKG